MGLPVVETATEASRRQTERRQTSKRKHRKSKEGAGDRIEETQSSSVPEKPRSASPISLVSPASPSSPPCGAERLADELPALHLTNGTNGEPEHTPPGSGSPRLAAEAEAEGDRPSGCELCGSESCATPGDIRFESYRSELQMADIMKLIQKDLSEPYSIYTYRYFIHNWPKLCFLAVHDSKCVGAIVCKLDLHRTVKRGYIAMLAVDEKYRKRKIGSKLVTQAILVMISDKADEVVLETEITNKPALRLYENLGFVRDKRLFRYYLNGVDALRLKLWLR